MLPPTQHELQEAAKHIINGEPLRFWDVIKELYEKPEAADFAMLWIAINSINAQQLDLNTVMWNMFQAGYQVGADVEYHRKIASAEIAELERMFNGK